MVDHHNDFDPGLAAAREHVAGEGLRVPIEQGAQGRPVARLQGLGELPGQGA